MQYYVLGPDGSRYGPADLATLQQWVNEGRVLPTTHLQSVSGGNIVPAQYVQSLTFFPTQTGSTYGASDPQPTGYTRYDSPTSKDVTPVLVKAILATVLCCLPLGVVAIIYAVLAMNQKGSEFGSRNYLQQANTWANWSIALGIIPMIFGVGSMLCTGGLGGFGGL